MRKPLHLKSKLFYQTKINLWGWDLSSKKFKKKKWSFLKQKSRGKIKHKVAVDNFRFSPFGRKFSRRSLRLSFKNNLYFRKLIRLKYGRLKNKEFHNLFKQYKGYKKLISKLGCRLDINLCNILSPISVFYIRQNILHGKVYLNGRKINSPNIHLKALDIISLKLSDFSNTNFLYQNPKEQAKYMAYIGKYLFKYSSFPKLNKESKMKFINNITNCVTKQYTEIFNEFLIEEFSSLTHSSQNLNMVFNNKEGSKPTDIKSFIELLNKKYLSQKILIMKNLKESRIHLSKIKLNSLVLNKKNKYLGFFNEKFNPNNFEIRLNGNDLDIVFLGFSEKDVVFGSKEKYLLHYLY